MSTPLVRISQDDATGLVTVEAQWTYDPRRFEDLHDATFPRIVQAQMASTPMIRELATLMAMHAGETPTEQVLT